MHCWCSPSWTCTSTRSSLSKPLSRA
ncbi:hypothetical protein [Nisaea nitritireducens]